MNARIRIAAWGVAAALVALAPGARAAGDHLPRPETRTLSNGLVVAVFPDARSGLVHVQLRVAAGVDAEPADQSGVANLTAQLLLAGTTTRDAERMAADLASFGAPLRASINRDHVTLGGTVLADTWETAIEVLADAAMNPLFPEREFTSGQGQLSRALLQSHQSPAAAADEQVWPFAMPGVPGARPPLGSVASVLSLTRDQVRQFHRDHYRPDHALLVVAGDVEPSAVFAQADEWFGRWSGKAAPPPAPAAPATGTRVRVVDLPESRYCDVRLAFSAPGRDAPDEAERSFAARLLSDALDRRFARAATGRDARVSLALLRDRGQWIVSASAAPESAAVLVTRLRAEVKKFFAATPAVAEVAATRRAVRGAFPLQFETLEGLVRQWSVAQLYGFPDDYFARYAAKLEGVTAENVAAAARRGVDLDSPSILVAGPAARLQKRLATFGAVEVVHLDPPAEKPAAPDTFPAPTAADAVAGRALLDQAIAAHGGLETLRGIHDSIVDADIRITMQQNTIDGTLRTIRREPNQLVYLTEVKEFRSRQVLNGNTAWTELGDAAQVQEADSTAVAALRAGFRSDLPHLLLDALDPAAHLAARGAGKLGELQAERLEVWGGPGGPAHRVFWFDATSHRLLAVDQTEQVARAGTVPARRFYREYRAVSGVQWPFEEERLLAGQPLMLIRASSVRLNPGVRDVEFQRARVPAPEPPKKK